MTKFMTAALVSTALLTTAAFAQTPSAPDTSTTAPSKDATSPATPSTATPATPAPSATTPAKDMSKDISKDTTAAAKPSDTSRNGTWRTSKIVGLSVYNDNNESVGSINELLTDDKGNIKAVVIGVGGLLGIGEHNVAVDFDKVKFVKEPVAYAGAGGAKSGGSSTTTTGAASGGSAQSAPAAKPNPWYPDHAVYSATKDQLKAMPDIKYTTN